jgi:pimeloyl-ACP methyl ester carboxylesterase
VPIRLLLAALGLLALAPIAFWRAYLAKLNVADRYTHAHVALGTAWFVLLAAQPLLVPASLRSWHRLLGRIGLIVGAAFFVSGSLIARPWASADLMVLDDAGHMPTPTQPVKVARAIRSFLQSAPQALARAEHP